MAFRILAHGGASTAASLAPAVRHACEAGRGRFEATGDLLDAVVATVQVLEDDGSFNAGRGSQPRLDGQTIELDAACMTDDGRFGAVACLEGIRNPVLAALGVHGTPHNLLVGGGATAFAHALGLEHSTGHRAEGVAELTRAAQMEGKMIGSPISIHGLLRYWNYPNAMPEALDALDTVGAVATDGHRFAVAGSTGGLRITLRGRASDLGIPGGGVFAGRAAAVAVTGNGEILGREQASRQIHEQIRAGATCDEAIRRVAALLPPKVGFGAIAVTRDDWGGFSNREMPWAMAD